MEYKNIIRRLKSLQDPQAVAGMARFGIKAASAYGVSMPELRKLGKEIGIDQNLALKLWQAKNRETRILAGLAADPEQVTKKLMDEWVLEFDSWEICDQSCMNLFEKTRYAYEKAAEWSFRKEEFVKRTGFVLMARLGVSDKKAANEKFESFFPHILRGADDDRNMVKKAVNWALRQIGKRNLKLNKKAILLAERVLQLNSRSAHWIATDALRELKSEAVQKRLRKKGE